MVKVKVCLYWSYITVTTLIGIISAIVLGAVLLSHVSLVLNTERRLVFYGIYAFSIVPLLLAIIGLFGACQKKKCPLILFAVGMILASLFMFAIEVNPLTRISKQPVTRKIFLNVGPLVNASDSFQDSLKEAQTKHQCCGLDQGYVEWGYNIPESCLCTNQSTEVCVAAPKDSMLFENRTNDQPVMIYKKPCLQFLINQDVYLMFFRVMMAFIFLWALSAVLSILILCQIDNKEDTSVVVNNPEVKASNNFSWAP